MPVTEPSPTETLEPPTDAPEWDERWLLKDSEDGTYWIGGLWFGPRQMAQELTGGQVRGVQDAMTSRQKGRAIEIVAA